MTHYTNTNNPIDFPKMNPKSKIQELAIEAGIISAEYNGFDPTGLTKAQRKFAELIVRECARVAEQWVDDEDNGHNLVSERLRQHFGVEECMN